MSGRKGRKVSLTPQEKYLRSVRAKRRFKALVRLAAANSSWLQEIDEDEQLGDNVKRNILLLTRKKDKKKGLLTLTDKAILNKPQIERTESDMIRLRHVIGDLKCFRRYPNDIKYQLPTIMYFAYFGPNRILLKQGNDPLNMYIIVSGDISVEQTEFDELLKENITTTIGMMGSGDICGELSLIHGIKRGATLKTLTACEFLYITKDDFDKVLKDTVLSLWQEVRNDLALFEYFRDWDEVSLRESCILIRKQSFPVDTVIFGGGIGQQDYVYFIVSGYCYLIQYLYIIPYYKNGNKHYKLYNYPDGDSASTDSISILDQVLNQHKSSLNASNKNKSSLSLNRPKSTKSTPKSSLQKSRLSGDNEKGIKSSIRKTSNNGKMVENHQEKNIHFTDEPLATSSKILKNIGVIRKSLVQTSKIDLPPNVNTYIIRVCIYQNLSCFNIGENLKHRRIVSATNTDCLLIPRYFLLQKNKGNIWGRIKEFLDNHIPTTQEVFAKFLSDRKWQKYKTDLVNDILSKKPRPYVNSIYNVPYSIRLTEDLSYDL